LIAGARLRSIISDPVCVTPQTDAHRSISLVGLPELSERLGIPLAWLRREADAGRIPTLRAGRRRLADVDRVRAAILDRAEEATDAR
jgi:hypothetical protein